MSTPEARKPEDRETKDRLALALDVDGLDEALRLWRLLGDSFTVAKVGLQLFSSAGAAAVSALTDEGALVFADLKLHDIPNTVGRASRAMAAAGAHLVTVHACGSEAMVRAAAEGFVQGSDGRVNDTIPAGMLGVTVLTSEPSAPPDVLRERAELAERAGCVGVVCAAGDLTAVREAVPGLLRVIPGVRLAGTAADDQARVATPAEALSLGADLLVVGRAVTAAADPKGAAARVLDEVRAARQHGDLGRDSAT